MIRCLDLFPDLNTNSSLATLSFNTTGIKNATIFSPPEDLVVTRLAVPFAADSGTPPDYRVSLQSVNASDGNPSGTILGSTNNAKANFNTVALTHGTTNWYTLGESASLSKFEKYAHVIEYSSGTIDGSNLSQFQRGMNSLLSGGWNISGDYSTRNTGASWSKDTNISAIFGYGTSGQKYGHPIIAARSTVAFNSGSSPNERGFCFTIPGSGRYRLRGVVMLATITAGTSVELTLYSGDGASDTTPIDTASLDTDCFVAVAVSGKRFLFPGTPPTLDYGSPYRLSFRSGSASSFTMYTTTVTSADDLGATIPGGSFYYSTRNGGNWTDSTTVAPIVYGLLIEEVAGSGGGRGVGHSCLIG